MRTVTVEYPKTKIKSLRRVTIARILLIVNLILFMLKF
jgi:hypothetical protein